MHWLKQLIHVPFVSILSFDGARAHLEVAGYEAVAHESEFGLCIGIRLPDAFKHCRVNDALLQLAAAEQTDDGLTIDDKGFLLWRRYSSSGENESYAELAQLPALKKRLEGQLAIVRHLGSFSRLDDATAVGARDVGSLA